jgi:hypothetical protein
MFASIRTTALKAVSKQAGRGILQVPLKPAHVNSFIQNNIRYNCKSYSRNMSISNKEIELLAPKAIHFRSGDISENKGETDPPPHMRPEGFEHLTRDLIKSSHQDIHEFNIGEYNQEKLEGVIYCPMDSGFNKHFASAELHTNSWVLEQGLFKETDQSYQNFCKANFSKLAASCYRDESESDLNLISDFLSWLFCHDDLRDDRKDSFGDDPKRIEDMNSIILKVLKTGIIISRDCDKINALSISMLDLRNRLIEKTDNIEHFVKSMENYFRANQWEAINRSNNVTPSLLGYIEQRQSTSAVYPCFELGCITRGIVLPNNIREDIFIKHMARNASNTICFTNDIFSFQKEIKEMVTENLIIVKRDNDGGTYRSALKSTAEMIGSEIKDFLNFKKLLGDDDKHTPFIALMESWIRGNLDWSLKTDRYNKHK